LANIERHVLALTSRLIEGAQRAGIEIKSDLRPEARSGIVLLDRGRANVEELMARAETGHVGITARENGVRVSPHGYNNESDIDRVLSVLVDR
jgi:selenocysteine lyase/cysteine desulfurase